MWAAMTVFLGMISSQSVVPLNPPWEAVSFAPMVLPRKFTTLVGWEEHRREIQLGMAKAMGFPGEAGLRGALLVEVLEERLESKYLLKKVSYVVDRPPGKPAERVRAWLLIPTGIEPGKRLPAALCLHQTTAIGKDEPAGLGGLPNLHLGKELAQRGFVVLCPDYPSFGEYKYDFKDNPHPSGTIKAVTDNRRALDFLQSLLVVDPHRIAAVGHSLGGHNALFSAAWDTRIKAVVTSCGFTRAARYYGGDLKGWTSDRYMPKINTEFGSDPKRIPFDFPGILAAIAPRPVFINAPKSDSNFEVIGVRECVEPVSAVYRFFGAGKDLVVEYPDSGHDFPPEVRRRAWDFLESRLLDPSVNKLKGP
ncbi:MAG: alpha/beta fold hydrolase [Gemmataceae bacterium]